MAKILIVLLISITFLGCYPPSYYDTWNAGSVQRYLEREEDFGDAYTYYRPYYSWYPYFYLPFSLSLSYSYISHDRHFRYYPYHRYFEKAGPRYYLRHGYRR